MAATVALGAVPVLVALVLGTSPDGVPMVVLCLAAGASLGWAGEDPAAELLSAMPLASPIRTAMRAAIVGVLAGLGGASVVVAVAIGPGLPPDLADRLPEAATAAAAALALALALTRRGERGGGPAGVGLGLLVPAIVAVLAVRWPTVLPSLSSGAVHDRWWVGAVALAVVAAWVGRDPAHR